MSFLVGAQIFNIVGRLLFSILLARYLGVADLGKIFFALSFVELFNIITDFGLGVIVTREAAAAREQGPKYLSNTIVIKLILSLISALLIILAVNLIPRTNHIRPLVYILLPAIFFNSGYAAFSYIFRAYEDMKQESMISLFTNFLYITFGLAAIYFKLNVFSIALITTVCAFCGFSAAALIYSTKYQSIELKFEWGFALKLIKMAFPVGIGAIFFMACSKIDVMILSYFKGVKAVGLYAAAYKLMSIFLFAPYVLATSMFPAMSQWHKEEKLESLRSLLEKSLKMMMIIIIPFAVFISLKSSVIISIIYGNQFLESVPVLAILPWYLVAVFPAFIFTHILCIADTKKYAFFNLITLIVSIILNLSLIPVLSITGMAISAVGSVLVLTFLCYREVYTGLVHFAIAKSVLLSGLASLGIVGVVFVFGKLKLLPSAISSAVIYCIILYCIKGIDKQDFLFISSFIRRK